MEKSQNETGALASNIAEAERAAAEQAAEVVRLRKLAEAYPDIRRHVGRWQKVAYYSKSVNAMVNRFDMRHNCGCCSDSPLEVWPYLETPLGPVYSDPPEFMVGERSYNGDRPYPGWEDELRKAGIPESIVNAISKHFAEE